jgi:hypothetical protein
MVSLADTTPSPPCDAQPEEYDLALEVTVPISSPPPLPGQNNDALPKSLGHWGYARICIRFRHFIWIEDLIQMAEEVIGNSRRVGLSADETLQKSSSTEHVLGGGGFPAGESSAFREHITAAAAASTFIPGQHYTMSVEHITKALGRVLANHPDIRWFTVSVENLSEGYSVFSSLEWPS